MEDLVCKTNEVHPEKIENIKKAIPNDEKIQRLAELFKVFGDPTRAKIMSCLELSELCVCDICACLDMTKSAVSHQLKILRDAHLVKYRKVGKEVIYAIDDDHVSEIFECGLSHVNE